MFDQLSAAVAGGFYGSLLSFSLIDKITPGWLIGGVGGVVAAQSLPIFTNDPALAQAALCGAHFWFFLLAGAWLFRERHRPPPYNSLSQAYLEAIADGVLVVNLPLTMVATATLFSGVRFVGDFVW